MFGQIVIIRRVGIVVAWKLITLLFYFLGVQNLNGFGLLCGFGCDIVEVDLFCRKHTVEFWVYTRQRYFLLVCSLGYWCLLMALLWNCLCIGWLLFLLYFYLFWWLLKCLIGLHLFADLCKKWIQLFIQDGFLFRLLYFWRTKAR